MPLPKKKIRDSKNSSPLIEDTHSDTREINHHGTSIRSITIAAPKYEHNSQNAEITPPPKPKKRGRPKGSKNKPKQEPEIELSSKPVEPMKVSEASIADAIDKDLIRRGLRNPTFNDY